MAAGQQTKQGSREASRAAEQQIRAAGQPGIQDIGAAGQRASKAAKQMHWRKHVHIAFSWAQFGARKMGPDLEGEVE